MLSSSFIFWFASLWCYLFSQDCDAAFSQNEHIKSVHEGKKLYQLWQYRLWSFQTGNMKLERFLPKNQHTQRIFLNFKNWTNGGPQKLAKIRVFKVD